MTRDEAIEALRREADALRARGATALYLFGSTARGAATPGSDIDVFIEFDRTRVPSLFDLVAMQHHLENRVGAPVDLTTRDALHPLLRNDIESSAVRVF
jgi:hypothetical protein